MTAALTSGDVAALMAADARVRSTKSALEAAELDRRTLRLALAPAVPYDAPQRVDVGDGVVLEVRRRRKSSGERVDLKGYRARYVIPKRLQAFIAETLYDDWQIRPADEGEV